MIIPRGSRVEVSFANGSFERGVVRDYDKSHGLTYEVLFDGPDVVRTVWCEADSVRKLTLLELVAEAAQ